MVRSWGVGAALALLVACVVLSGCASKANAPTPSASASQTAAPVVARIAVFSGTNLTQPVNGSIVAKVGKILAFDGSNSTGAITIYSWAFGDNATSANRRAEHAFAKPGAYNVTLKVSTLANVSANATVRILVPAPTTGRALFRDHQAFEGSLPLMNPNSCTNQGIDCDDHAITILAKDPNGTTALAKHVRINVTGSSTLPADMQLFWKSPDGTTLQQTAASGTDLSIDYAEAMPPGDYIVRVRLFTGAQVTYNATVDVDYVST